VKKLHPYILTCFAAFLAACSTEVPKSEIYKIALVPEIQGQSGIYTLNSDRTGGKRVVTDDTAQLRPSSWSPDGKKIAFFAARSEDYSIRQKYKMPLHFPLYLMNSSGGEQKRLLDFPASSFEWSPDSLRLLVVSAYEDPAGNDPAVLKQMKAPMSAAYILDLQTGAQNRVTGFAQYCYGSWSPDGSRLAISFGDTKSSDIFVSTVDGKRTWRVSDSTGINLKPAWSPDGKRIAYISFVPKSGVLVGDTCVIEFNGSNKKQYTNADAYEVAWSRDGKWLMLKTAKGFLLQSVDENLTVEMKNKVIQPQDPVFTPDGKGVMFRSNHEGPNYLYTVDLNGDNIVRMSGNLSASWFALSHIRQ